MPLVVSIEYKKPSCLWEGQQASKRNLIRQILSALACTCVAMHISAAPQSKSSEKNGPVATQCIASAAKYHKVNRNVLSAILKVESAYQPAAINRNADGSMDVGIGQINSVHFKELASNGIAPEKLVDACVGSYVAAWHLGRQVQRHGNTWFAIGAYHSVTPYNNTRYQALVYNAMVDMAAVPGPKLEVEPAKTP